jgi:uncharacterized protein (DUF433 family)
LPTSNSRRWNSEAFLGSIVTKAALVIRLPSVHIGGVMNKTSVMTLRVPIAVRRGLERLAAQLGYKPAQLGARLVEEGIRRRIFPQIELRDAAAGRVAYVKGTRLTVCWIVEQVRNGLTAEKVARDFDISVAQVNAALAYGEAFRSEIDLDLDETEANRQWLNVQESAWQAGHPGPENARRPKSRK